MNSETDACLNCGAALTGAYCASCGQKRPHPDITLHELLHETTHELAHWDGKTPSTLKALFLRPGLLTLDFLAGRRARWLPPLRLYVICSLAYFLSGPFVESITHRSAREMAKVTITSADGRTEITPEIRQEIAEGLPGRVFGSERLIRAAEHSRDLNRAINAAFPKAMFVLLPLFALITSRIWRRALPHYPAHLYAALHLHAAWFGILTLFTLSLIVVSPTSAAGMATGLVALAYMAWYTLVALKRVFRDSWPRTIVKGLATAMVYSVALLAMSLAMLGYAVATM
jgi:uncharacterized protein DUF3667